MSAGNGINIASAQYAKTINITKTSAHGWMPIAIKYKVKHHKEKKMGWFKRKFAQWSREAWENGRDEMIDTTVRAHDGINGKTSVRFTVYPASGGYVIEHYKQDRFKDSDGPCLTIVNNGDSLGTAVEHILTMEALKA